MDANQQQRDAGNDDDDDNIDPEQPTEAFLAEATLVVAVAVASAEAFFLLAQHFAPSFLVHAF